MNTNTPTLDSFCHGAATILGLESALSGKPVEPEWLKKVTLWKTGLFRIVVMGDIKKGKSSFINALLGYKPRACLFGCGDLDHLQDLLWT